MVKYNMHLHLLCNIRFFSQKTSSVKEVDRFTPLLYSVMF